MEDWGMKEGNNGCKPSICIHWASSAASHTASSSVPKSPSSWASWLLLHSAVPSPLTSIAFLWLLLVISTSEKNLEVLVMLSLH
jgi:hypothetical protein